MRTFEHPNKKNFICPICKTQEDKPVVLVAILGTEKDGIVQARQYHLDCIHLTETTIATTTYLLQKVR